MITGTSGVSVTWMDLVPVTNSDKYEVRQVWPCRCGTSHLTLEEFEEHQIYAPARSLAAKELRESISAYLNHEIDGDELAIRKGKAWIDSSRDRELQSVLEFMAWACMDYEHERITLVGFKSMLRQIAEEPELAWRCKSISLKPEEHING